MTTYAYEFKYDPNTGEYKSRAIEGKPEQVPFPISCCMGKFRDELMREESDRKKPISVEVKVESDLIQ